MYNEHFGLQRAPFRITPDTKLFYPGGNRGEILEALMYAVASGEGIVKVVGEVGSGKTMLCRMLQERLADRVDIVYLANPSLSPHDTLQAIAVEMKLDVAPDANRLQVMHALQERLLDKHADNRQVVVFVEEAQSMPMATLEEIRLLSNLETNRDKLLQIILFGQPELDDNLGQLDIRQLNERITHSFYLQAFTPGQMREYVNFRMRAVGYRGPDIFRGAACRRMAKASEGLTRRINILADKALLAAFAEDTFDVAARHVSIAINDSPFVRVRRRGMAEISLISGLVLVVAVAAVAWTFGQRSESSRAVPLATATDTASEQIAAPVAGSNPHTRGAAASAGETPKRARHGDSGQQAPIAVTRLAVPATGRGAADRDEVASSLPAPASGETRVTLAEGLGSLTEARLAATRNWLASADHQHFSIQLLLTDFARRGNLETFLRERQNAGEVDNYFVFETRIRSHIWYGVLYREYPSFGAAKAALEELPEELRYHQPFIRNVRDIATLG